jgi:ABC-type transport system substrate-binding protein
MTASADWAFASGYNPHGGYLDKFIWSVYAGNPEAAFLALRQGTIDGYDDRVFASDLPSLLSTYGITVTVMPGLIYRQFSLNCGRFPTNITGWRRALAYATDKFRIADESTGGFATPMDGCIPTPVGLYCQESSMTEHYYTKDIAKANASLLAAHFLDMDGDGWREYDVNQNGVWDGGIDVDDTSTDPIMSVEAWCSAGYDPAIRAVTVGVEGLAECGIHATVKEVSFNAMSAYFAAGLFSWACFSWNIAAPGEPTLMYDFWRSGQSYNEYYYWFSNATYDTAADHLMNATSLSEAQYWTHICQDMLIQNMPMVTCYNDAYINAFRTDKWEGYVNFTGVGFMGSNYWTPHQLRLRVGSGGPYGGTYRECCSEGMESSNLLMSNSGYTAEVLNCIYDSLWLVDPQTWAKVPDLAYNWTIESTVAGGGIQNGAKYTFKLYENATWHDGLPVTSQDVKYSLMNLWPQSPYASTVYQYIYRIDTPDDHTVVIYDNMTGYFEFSRSTAGAIFPRHIWKAYADLHTGNVTGFVPTTVADFTGSSCFKWNSQVPGEYYALDYNPNWHFAIAHGTATPILGPELLLLAGVGIAVIVIVIIAGVYYFRIRK